MKLNNPIILILVFFCLVSSFIVTAQELGRYIEQYEGQAGTRTFRVKVLRIGDKANEEVLIQVIGVDDPLEGNIYKYKKEWQSSEKRLNQYKFVTTQIPGKERYGLFHSENYYGNQVFKVYLMDAPMKAITVYPAETQSDLDPKFMYSQYLQQQKKVTTNPR